MTDFEGNSTATYAFQDIDTQIGVLTIVSGPDQGSVHAMEQGVLRIGSGEVADLRLEDRGVSRLHCELEHVGASLLQLRDLGSKNGTWVAGCRIRDAEIPPGTRVRVGSTTIELSVDQRRVRKAVWQGGDRFGEVLGASPVMHRLFALLARLVDAEGVVLVRGETGTGKDVVARSIHAKGPRAAGPFVIVDGAAMSRTLADAELFGHERGAFTGAEVARAGAFERAHSGTLFIDEIAEIPIEVQSKLLRALSGGGVRRIGGSETRHMDVRVIAATHRPLERMVNEGAFRDDLLHRLKVFEVLLPPLRERPEDVVLLARRFLEEVAPGDGRLAEALEAALAARAGYLWPGNVRELVGFVRRLVALGDPELGRPLPPGDGPVTVDVDLPLKEAKRVWVDALERQYLSRLLAETGNNVSEAARRAGMDRGHLGALAAKHGLKS